MQMAPALGTPIIGVFTGTSPVISGPPDKAHELVASGVSCAASYRRKCPYRGRKHMACTEGLDIERVWTAFGRLSRGESDAACSLPPLSRFRITFQSWTREATIA
jgi:heptosyltransferase I